MNCLQFPLGSFLKINFPWSKPGGFIAASMLARHVWCGNFTVTLGIHTGSKQRVTREWFLFGSQRRWSLSLLVLTLIFPALLPCLVRDSLCTALQTKILWINWSLNAIDTIETWVSGNLTALMKRSQPAIRWRVGEVANRVSCGSFRGGHWYLPFRNHDNRYFADWIRLYPGLSKNSENGNSCPKPHKAARMIEAVGRAVSIETETIIAIWILPRRSSRLYKGKLIKMRPKWTKTDRE